VTRQRREPETGRIESVTHDGRGIVDQPGKKVFVAGALAGETVRYVRRKRHRNFDDAELLEVLEAAPGRVGPRCAVFGRCGGCALQHIDLAEQRRIKAQALADSLERIGRVQPGGWLPAIESDGWNYRRRARLAVKDVPGKGRVLVGFRERHAPFVTDMLRCEVLAAPIDGLIEALSELVGRLSIRARLPQIEVAVADEVTALVFRVLDPPSEGDRDEFRRFASERDLDVWLQPGAPDTLEYLGPKATPRTLRYALPDFDLDIEFAPLDFVQVNATVNRRMVARAIELLEVGPEDRVLDLFCGIGNFSLPLASRAGHVLGIEGEAALVARARANAERLGLSERAEFLRADLAALDGSEPWLHAAWDRLLLDPARSGAAAVVDEIGRLSPARIVYVSCHPGTLARDAGVLVNEAGYRLESAGIIDMFPHTAHVESIAVFGK
jgi:23S rRNA (uracil1939-C5)-methyltransferase